MNILSFDTSIGECTVALQIGKKMLISTSPKKMSQSKELIPRINAILKEASIEYKDLNYIACTLGPGSFTGIRVGIAAARGIKKAVPHITILGISTLDLIAQRYYQQTLITNQNTLIALQSYGEYFYTKIFKEKNNNSSTITILHKEEIEKHNQNKLILNVTDAALYINAYNLITITQKNIERYVQNEPLPLYVQQPNIHIKKNI